MRAFLGGVPKATVCDNLKAGVAAASRYEAAVNRTYRELSAHYGTTIMPTRPRKPRDKAKVEVEVAVRIVRYYGANATRHESISSLNLGI